MLVADTSVGDCSCPPGQTHPRWQAGGTARPASRQFPTARGPLPTRAAVLTGSSAIETPRGFEVWPHFRGDLYPGAIVRREREGSLFCFLFNCVSPDTLTCIMSIRQKKDFLPLLFKNEISRERELPSGLFTRNNVYTPRGGKRARFFQVLEEGISAEGTRGRETLLTISQQNL